MYYADIVLELKFLRDFSISTKDLVSLETRVEQSCLIYNVIRYLQALWLSLLIGFLPSLVHLDLIKIPDQSSVQCHLFSSRSKWAFNHSGEVKRFLTLLKNHTDP